MSSKTKNKRNSESIIKNGTATSILSACDKPFIADHLTDYRDKFNRLNNENEKSKVKLEQMGQLRKDNDNKLIQLSKKNDTINKLHITITQLNSDIKLLKETTNDRGDYQRLEGFIKKKDHEIEELKKQIDSTKINQLVNLENEMVYLKENRSIYIEEIKTLKAENKELKEQLNKDNTQSRFDLIRVLSDDIKKVSDENIQIKRENELLEEENHQLIDEKQELIQKLDEYKDLSTQLFDLRRPA